MPSYSNWGYQKHNLLTQYVEKYINPEVKKKPRTIDTWLYLPG